MNIIFFGTANFALPILEKLNSRYSITAVVTSPDAKVGRQRQNMESPAALLAGDLNLPLFKPENLNDSTFIKNLKKLEPDIFITAAYGKIFPAGLIDLPRRKTLNVHASLLPEYRGPAPIQSALLNGDAETGASIMIMAPELDAGAILAQEKIAIHTDDTYITLSDRLAHLAGKLLIRLLDDYIAGKITPQAQNPAGATWTKIISKQDGKIDWNKTAPEIYNQFRAFYPWPGIWTSWNGQTLKILDCAPLSPLLASATLAPAQPGTVAAGGAILCGNQTLLQIRNLQLAGKKESDIESFLRGHKNFINSSLA